MKSLNIISFSLVLCMLMCFVQCKTSENTVSSFTEYQGTKLIFGNEGGFAGTRDEYHLLEDGRLFRLAPRSIDYVFVKSIDSKKASQFFHSYENLKMQDETYQDPGNLSYFLKNTDYSDHLLTWGGEQKPVNQKVRAYYRALLQLVK